jgi:thiamine-phosphate diphosphorylase
LLEVIGAAVRAGVSAVQIREKDMEAGELLAEVTAVSELLDELADTTRRGSAGVKRPLLLLDDRIDVALAVRNRGVGLDGVHIGQGDLPAADAREILGPDAVIGISARDEEAISRIDPTVVDYVGTGPVHTTQSKPGIPSGIGYSRWSQLREAVRAVDAKLPVVAIGGITPTDAEPLRALGADGYCCITYISEAPDVEAAAGEFVKTWTSAVERSNPEGSREVI